MIYYWKHPFVAAIGTGATILAALHVINIFLGVAGGLFALSAGYYHWRKNRAEWKKFRKANPDE
jgi:hypothetical protein